MAETGWSSVPPLRRDSDCAGQVLLIPNISMLSIHTQRSLTTRIRTLVKAAAQGLSLLASLPFATLAGFGRFSSTFQIMSHLVALIPGLPGDYLRVAYYSLTLDRCSLNSRISFGSFFAQSSASVGEGVYIGAYCVLGGCRIGDRTQIASHVQTLGGQHQHRRTADGQILAADEKAFATIEIGDDCWIGASAILMADVGSRSTVGAGAIVTRSIPADVIAVGNPARVMKHRTLQSQLAPGTDGKEEMVC